jgi:hypothetical protein
MGVFIARKDSSRLSGLIRGNVNNLSAYDLALHASESICGNHVQTRIIGNCNCVVLCIAAIIAAKYSSLRYCTSSKAITIAVQRSLAASPAVVNRSIRSLVRLPESPNQCSSSILNSIQNGAEREKLFNTRSAFFTLSEAVPSVSILTRIFLIS